jgi:glucose/arabinose dehydrogenase
VMALNGDGTAVEQQWTRITDRGRLRSAVLGPDGALYLATDANPGSILRVTPPAQ